MNLKGEHFSEIRGPVMASIVYETQWWSSGLNKEEEKITPVI